MTLMLGFEEPVPMHDQREPEVERRSVGHGHAEVAARDQHAAVQHGAPRAEERSAIQPPGSASGTPSGVHAVDAPAVAVSNPRPPFASAARHEQHEQGAHAVVAEALPHLGEEQRREPARVAEERAVLSGIRAHGTSARSGMLINDRI